MEILAREAPCRSWSSQRGGRERGASWIDVFAMSMHEVENYRVQSKRRWLDASFDLLEPEAKAVPHPFYLVFFV